MHNERKQVMMRICPECKKAFYVPVKVDRVRCHHCHFTIYMGRNSERITNELEFTLTLRNEKIRARLRDYSREGIGIFLDGKNTLNVGVVVNVDIDEVNIHRPARAVWIRKKSRSVSSAGLQLL